MNGKKKLISKITALLLALLLTNHFVFQAYASGETEVVVTESVAEAVADESEATAAEAVEAEEPAEAPTADIPAAVDEAVSEEPEAVAEVTPDPTVLEAAPAEEATESALEELAAEEAASEEAPAEEAPAEEAAAEEAPAEEAAEEVPAEVEEELVEEAAAPAAVGDDASAWSEISHAFTVENIMAAGIADANFAQAIFDNIVEQVALGGYGTDSTRWFSDLPMPLTLDEIANGDYADDVALAKAIVENYAGEIDARRCGVSSIEGWQLLKSAASVDVSRNQIEDLTAFTQANAPTWSNGMKAMHASWDFQYNPLWKYPTTSDEFPTLHSGNASYSFSPSLSATARMFYLFGEPVDATIVFSAQNGYVPIANWRFNQWATYSAAGTEAPSASVPLNNGQNFEGTEVTLYDLTEAGTLAFNISLPMLQSHTGVQGFQEYWHQYNLIPSATIERYGLLYVDLNTETLGGFHFKKTSTSSDAIPVEGAVYTLYKDEACTDVYGTYTTDANGEFTVTGLPPQTYYLKETETPAGYELSDEVIPVTIEEVTSETTVEGGVSSISLDARTDASALKTYDKNIVLTGKWSESNNGALTKNIDQMSGITAQMIDPEAKAIITNKGTTSYNTITNMSASAAGENYDTDVKVVVTTGLSRDAATEIGTYTSLEEAKNAINAYTDASSLNGNIYVEISNTYTQKVDAYAEVTGKDAPEEVSVVLPVKKTVEGGDGSYTFKLSNDQGTELETVPVRTANGTGTAEFSPLTFTGPNPFNTEDGTYTYVVTEVPGNEAGVTYDDTVYTYVVTIKEGPHKNEAGEDVQGLYAEVTMNGQTAEDLTASFVNVKMKPVAVQLKALKTLENAKLLNDEFSFELVESSESDEAFTTQGTVDENGVITFNAITYMVPGTFNYEIRETGSTVDGITLDETVAHVSVIVELDPAGTNGASIATVYVDGRAVGTAKSDGTMTPAAEAIETGIEFTNIAELPTVDFEGTKTKDDDFDVEFGEFTFKLTADDYTGLELIKGEEATALTADAIAEIPSGNYNIIDFDSVFDCIRFPAEEKTYTFTLTENDPEEGCRYNKDTSVITIKVPVVLDEATGKYVVGEVTYENDGEQVDGISFLNTEKRAPLTVTKTVAAGGDTTKPFEFTVIFDEPIDDLVLAPGATTVLDGLEKIGFKFSLKDGESMTIKNIPIGIGYTVTETAEAGSSYLPTNAITGTIAEEEEGVENKAEFTNVIKRGPISITKEIENTKDYMNAGEDEFEFKITLTPGTGAALDGFSYVIDNEDAVEVDGLETTVSIKAGQVIQLLDLPYGTTVSAEEVNAEDLHYEPEESKLEGVIYSGTQGENDLKLAFVNVKKPVAPIAVTLEASKTVDGAVPATVEKVVDGKKQEVPFEGAFQFGLARKSAPEGAGQLSGATQTAYNNAEGKIEFDQIAGFDTPGEYVFEIWEMTESDPYITCDTTRYEAKVTVSYDKTNNKLVIDSVEYEGGEGETAVFDNKTVAPAPAKAPINVEKTVNGAAPVLTGTYSFVLSRTSAPEGAEAFETVTAFDGAGGKVDFAEITYTVPGTYVYEVKEIKGDVENIIYDGRTWTVTVVVEDDGTATNTLGATTTYTVEGENPSVEENPTDKAQFANYTKVPAEIPVKKTIDGDPIYGIPTFTFTIEASEETPDAPLPEEKTVSFEEADFENNQASGLFEITYEAEGTYKYTVYETAETKDGWTYDTAPMTAVVTVTFENGALKASVETFKDTEDGAFVNTFVPMPIKFSKQDLGGEELPGATIQVIDENGTVVEEWKSTDTPYELVLKPGNYTMHEVAAPEGYTVTTDIPFTVDENGLVEGDREVDMTDGPTKVVISKQDLGGEELPGATITIYDKDGNVAKTVFDEVCEWTSSETPKTIEGLPVGSYTLHEVVAPEGYTVTTDINFTISEDGTVTVTDEEGNPVDVEELVLTDAPIVVNFSKTDAGGEELPGAVITVFDSEGNVAKTVKGEELTWTSTTEPKVIEGLPAGEYVMHEDTAPAGYTLTNDIRFKVEADTGKVTILEINGEAVEQDAEDSTVVMVDELTDISISKQDLGGEELPGATITIFDKDGNVAKTVDGTECSWVSSDTPHEIKGLPAGSYVLHEVVAPEGYTVTTDINFTINEDGAVTVTDENGNPVDVDELVLTDAPTEVKFSKTDMGGKELPGAKIVVYDEKGEIAKTVFGEELNWTSTDTPKVVTGLPAGKYVMHEVAAPEGFVVATDITFVVEADTGKVTVIAVNGEAVDAANNTIVMVDGPVITPSVGTPTPSAGTPTPSAGTPTPSTKTTTGTNAKTGDPSNALLWVMTAIDSVGIFAAGTLIGRKKRKEEDEEE